jgi:Na+/proline symporter
MKNFILLYINCYNFSPNFLQASDREMLWVLRISVMVIATFAAIIALTVGSVYYLS